MRTEKQKIIGAWLNILIVVLAAIGVVYYVVMLAGGDL